MVYVGVDLHRKTAHVVAVDQGGAAILSRRVATRPDELLRVFGELDHQPLEVAFEATFGWAGSPTSSPMPASLRTWLIRWPPRRSPRRG